MHTNTHNLFLLKELKLTLAVLDFALAGVLSSSESDSESSFLPDYTVQLYIYITNLCHNKGCTKGADKDILCIGHLSVQSGGGDDPSPFGDIL